MKTTILVLLSVLYINQDLLAEPTLTMSTNANYCPCIGQEVTLVGYDMGKYGPWLERKWIVTNGSFSSSAVVKETSVFGDMVTVYWDANQSTGTIKMEMPSAATQKASATVNIRSIGGVIPKFSNNKSSEVLPCTGGNATNSLSILLEEMSYIGGSFDKVSYFEWTLPSGVSWSGMIGTVVTGRSITLAVSPEFVEGVVKVKGRSVCKDKNDNYLYSNTAQYTITRNLGTTLSKLCDVLKFASVTPLPFKGTRASIVTFSENCLHPPINNTNYLPTKLYNDLQCNSTAVSSACDRCVLFDKKFAIAGSNNSLVTVYVKGDKRSTTMLCIVEPSGRILHTMDAAVNFDGVVLKQFEILADGKIVIYTIRPNTSIPYTSSWTSFTGMRIDETFIIKDGKFKQIERREYNSMQHYPRSLMEVAERTVRLQSGGMGWATNEIWRGDELLMLVNQAPQPW